MITHMRSYKRPHCSLLQRWRNAAHAMFAVLRFREGKNKRRIGAVIGAG
jgi:hypothetical protein